MCAKSVSSGGSDYLAQQAPLSMGSPGKDTGVGYHALLHSFGYITRNGIAGSFNLVFGSINRQCSGCAK